MTERPHEWAPDAAGVVRFQVVWLGDGYHWELFNSSGTPVVRSSATYATEAAAADAAEHARAHIGTAPIVPSA